MKASAPPEQTGGTGSFGGVARQVVKYALHLLFVEVGDAAVVQRELETNALFRELRSELLGEIFDLEPNSLGALIIKASSPDLLAMSRTYNTPTGEPAGTALTVTRRARTVSWLPFP